LSGGEREVVGGLLRDLELTRLGADPDGADLAARDAAPSANQGQQPAGLRLLARPQVDLEEHRGAREVAV
jgi:hypothetical protein